MSFFGQEALNTADHQFLSEGVWKTVHRDVYTYDAAGNLISDSFLRRNDADTGWENMELFTYTYDSNNNLIEEVLGSWDSNLAIPAYVDNIKTVYSYNSNHEMIEFIEYFWLNNDWSNSFKFTISYTDEGKISEGYSYNWVGSDWVLSDRTILTYNENGYIYNLMNDNWDGNNWVQNEATEFTLYANNKIILEFVKAWNGTEYLDNSKTEYQYDGNGNQISEDVYYVNNGVFEFGYGETFAFDTNFLMSSFTHPFNQTTGLDYVLTGFPFVNKLLSSSNNSGNGIITYNYGEATADVDSNEVIEVKAYPNPTNDIVIMETSELEKVDVYNILGKKLFSVNHKQIDLTNFSNGVYLFKVYTNDGRVANRKIIKN
ncbi:hypothetical protein PHEL85_0945 [Polaribacter sp. Hel1_85]|nr:hypothetical protein PHEL85_0945 [Polaribacter sp. Hel1_85]